MDAAAQYALAYSLTTATGVRAAVALALVSAATHFGVLHPPETFSWLASPVAMWVLIVVAGAEVLGDKVPLLDHALHVAQIVVKPAAAAIIVGSTVHTQSQQMLIFLMVIGALNALGIHAGVMATRAASTATTAGMANPAISTVEDIAAIGSGALAFFAPILVAIVVLFIVVTIAILMRRIGLLGRRKVTGSP